VPAPAAGAFGEAAKGRRNVTGTGFVADEHGHVVTGGSGDLVAAIASRRAGERVVLTVRRGATWLRPALTLRAEPVR
jgi:hypothetical protein